MRADGLHEWTLNDGQVHCVSGGCRGQGRVALDLRGLGAFTMATVVEALARHALEYGSVEVVDQTFAVESSINYAAELVASGGDGSRLTRWLTLAFLAAIAVGVWVRLP